MFRPVLSRVTPHPQRCLALLTSLALWAGAAAWASSARADEPFVPPPLPLSSTSSLGGYDASPSQPLTIAQQRARYDADQRMMRMQWNKWVGYEPLRPSQPNVLMNNETNPYYLQPVWYRPVWSVWNNGSRIW